MKETMRAAVLRGYHEPLQIEEKPIPVPGPGEVLVKVRASGLCVSDIHIQARYTCPTPPAMKWQASLWPWGRG